MIRARVVATTLRAVRAVDLGRRAVSVAEQVALASLNDAERAELGRRLYARVEKYMGLSAHNLSGLFGFERRALEAFFPKPPARVLVLGCGGGREIAGLLDLGFQIAGASDPVPAFVASVADLLRSRGHSAHVWVSTHQEFVARPELAADAVIVGWGSYSYIAGAEARVRFLRALRASSPGPVLLSYWGRGVTDPLEEPRLSKLMRTLLSRLPWSEPSEPGDSFTTGYGYVHSFAPTEVEAEARAAGYDVAFRSDTQASYPHAVLIPTRTPSR